jgi:predicted component of type VI protein secretion system
VLVRFVLGRGQECDLVINHASVSRHHAEIRFRNGQFRLFDMSTNGTHVITASGNMVIHRSDRHLPDGGRIALGRTENSPGLQIQFQTD